MVAVKRGAATTEGTPLMDSATNGEMLGLDEQEKPEQDESRKNFFRKMSSHWLPRDNEPVVADVTGDHSNRMQTQPRSLRRRAFLLISEPESSLLSAIIFGVVILLITLMNVVMILQTMSAFQHTLTECAFCGGSAQSSFEDSTNIFEPIQLPDGTFVECVCPPIPYRWTEDLLTWLVYFFTVEWILRAIMFEPAHDERASTTLGFLRQWLGFVTSTNMVLDFLAVFPYYFELSFDTNGLMSLRLLRLFRVFQLVRLGHHNQTFTLLMTVLVKSVPYLQLLIIVLLFGAAFFGSMLYWLEKGEWKYWEDTGTFEFVRVNQFGLEEITPFNSIMKAFWWFLVTSTTVGYGDTFPTSSGGQWVAVLSMLTGLMVVAFPVSVFSELWQKELKKSGAMADFEDDEEGQEEKKNAKLMRDDINNRSNTLPETNPTVTSSQLFKSREFSEDLNDATGAFVTMSKDDWGTLLQKINEVHQLEKEIRSVLRKYVKNN